MVKIEVTDKTQEEKLTIVGEQDELGFDLVEDVIFSTGHFFGFLSKPATYILFENDDEHTFRQVLDSREEELPTNAISIKATDVLVEPYEQYVFTYVSDTEYQLEYDVPVVLEAKQAELDAYYADIKNFDVVMTTTIDKQDYSATLDFKDLSYCNAGYISTAEHLDMLFKIKDSDSIQYRVVKLSKKTQQDFISETETIGRESYMAYTLHKEKMGLLTTKEDIDAYDYKATIELDGNEYIMNGGAIEIEV